jgi:hypothetical protein
MVAGLVRSDSAGGCPALLVETLNVGERKICMDVGHFLRVYNPK